ncbi:hypothetical protein, partial [Brachyspira pilosicoli]|uniref:hypothetical protein n=1 Tax=Brachyspira pilosicoli TaxID=52584 RepID=UPI001CA5D737
FFKFFICGGYPTAKRASMVHTPLLLSPQRSKKAPFLRNIDKNINYLFLDIKLKYLHFSRIVPEG